MLGVWEGRVGDLVPASMMFVPYFFSRMLIIREGARCGGKAWRGGRDKECLHVP